ncbi:MAG: hypothetical protein UZ21_OP11001000763 [Microgenomates bacterium OLB22]|nr:MAG: hypothetical protein UZ21_OP11001000763 [Microgenomates bacterium OLB22]
MYQLKIELVFFVGPCEIVYTTIMLYIYAGEDIATAHQNYMLKQTQLRTEGYELIYIDRKRFPELEAWLSDSQLLFYSKR